MVTSATFSVTSETSVFSSFSTFTSSLLAATLAKLNVGRTVGANVGLDSFGEVGVWVAGGGVIVRLSGLRSEAVRELVRDIGCAFSRRSSTSFSRGVTSTGLRRRLR